MGGGGRAYRSRFGPAASMVTFVNGMKVCVMDGFDISGCGRMDDFSCVVFTSSRLVLYMDLYK